MDYRFNKEDIKQLNIFIKECSENLQSFQNQLINLKKYQEDPSILQQLYRDIHSIKGKSSFMGITGITKLAHQMECIFEDIKKNQLLMDDELLHRILEASDFLGNLIREVDQRLQKLKSNKSYGDNSKDEFIIKLKSEGKVNAIISATKELLDNKVKLATKGHEMPLEVLNSDEFKNKISKEFTEQFVIEAIEHLDNIQGEFLVRLSKNNSDREAINGMFRAIHSVKGGAGIIISSISNSKILMPALKSLSKVAHSFETLMSIFRDQHLTFNSDNINLSYQAIDHIRYCLQLVTNSSFDSISDDIILGKIEQAIKSSALLSESIKNKDKDIELSKLKDQIVQDNILQTIRVSQDKIDKLMNMIAELIITKNSFFHISKKLNVDYNLPDLSKEVKEVGFAVNRISEELQDTVMSIRMVEIKTVFQRIPRIVRDISQLTNKLINLNIEGETTEIDKTIVEQISDPLVHIIRNAADHGIESPEERKIKGKKEQGNITLRAYNKNKHVTIEIEDDGKGIDVEEVTQKALDKGFIKNSDLEVMNKSLLLNLIFLPGFSTAKQVTEVSGRGVGLDVVKSNISRLKGTVDIYSEVGKGTKIIIKLPLTLTVSRGLLVEVGNENYIIPLDSIIETVKLQKTSIHKFNDKNITQLRGEVIGVEWLGKILLHDYVDKDKGEFNAVVIGNGRDKMAVIVDRLKSEQEIVVKPLSDYLPPIPGIAGSTLLGNGQVILILNPGDIIDLVSN